MAGLRTLGPLAVLASVLGSLGILSSDGLSAAQEQRRVRLIPAPPAAPQAQPSAEAVLAQFRFRVITEGEIPVIVEVRAPGAARGQMEETPEQDALRNLAAQAATEGLLQRLPAQARPVRRFETIPFVAMRVDAATFEALLADPEVVSIQEDFLVEPTLAQSVPLIQADQAHTAGFTGAGKAVAILDTGVDKTHSDFGGRVVSEACYSGAGSLAAETVCPGGVFASTAAGSGVPCSLSLDGGACFHGTHVGGIAAGNIGVAKSSSIIAIQVFSNINGAVRAYNSDILAGLERVYALRNTYSIAALNMSLGGGGYTTTCDSASPSVTTVISNLRTAGIASVIASGNNGYTNAISWPGCISHAVSVGSTTKADEVSTFTNSANFLSLLAPGGSITAAVPGGGFGTASGTSMAAPHVAGAWALLKHKKGALSVSEGLTALQSTGVSVVDPGNGLTFKRIRVKSALDSITATPPPAPTLVSPTGNISTRTPGYVFNKVNVATQYQLYVQPSAGGAAVINSTHSSASICGASTCTITPSTMLTNGTQYNWWARAYDGTTWSNWSSLLSFTPTGLGKAPLTSPSGTITNLKPAYQWGKVTGSTWYLLYVQPVAGGAPVINTWYATADVCGASACTVTPNVTLAAGTQYNWWIRTYDTAGGPWSDAMTFTPTRVGAATVTAPTGTISTRTPTYSWNKVTGSTWYLLYVQPVSGGAPTINTWYTSAAVCGASTCSVTPATTLANGTQYRVWVQTYDTTGGPWSSPLTFTPFTVGPATLLAPTGSSGVTPTYSWNKVTGSTWYLLYVQPAAGGTPAVNTWFQASAVCGASTCSVNPGVALTPGTQYRWWIRTYDTVGGPWSSFLSFTPGTMP